MIGKTMLIKNINLIFIFLLLPIINNYSFDSLSVKKHNEFLPVAYYPFDGNANDISGNNIHGEVFGAELSSNLQGDNNKAYFFDGIDDNINIGVNSNLQIKGDLSISIWIKIDSLDGSIRTVLNCQADNTDIPETNALYSLHFLKGNNWLTYTHESGVGINQANDFDKFRFENKVWYHIVIIRSVDQKFVELFVDGHKVDKIVYSENPEFGSLSGLRIGKSNGTIKNSYFNGSIDELYIFDKLIDNEKIIELYTLNAKLKAPSNLTLSFIDDNTIKLLWEDNSIREDGYEIERKLSDGSFNLISLINSNIKTFIDFDKDNNLEYCYRIRAFKDVEFASYSDYSNEVCTNITEFDEELNIANIFELSQNYPNPFNPITTIRYSIPQSIVIANEVKQSNEITSVNSFPRNDNFNVSLKIYDVLGKEVATLVNKTQSAGNYEVHFDASEFPSGVYYYQLKASNFIQTKKMVLLK